MKNRYLTIGGLFIVVAMAALFVVAQDSKPTEPAAPATAPAAAEPTALMDRVSYAFGLQMGGELKANNLPINPDMLAQGIKDALSGKPPKLTPEQLQATMMEFQQVMMAKQAEEQKKLAEAAPKSKAEGDKFLADNKGKPGVKTTASGLQYQVLQEGTGKSPTKNDTVIVHYKGTLISGKEFDSSYKRGTPAEFPVGGVIPGWTEGLQLMKVGGKYKLWIPSDLAYGERGAGADIPPNTMLMFDVELLGIK